MKYTLCTILLINSYFHLGGVSSIYTCCRRMDWEQPYWGEGLGGAGWQTSYVHLQPRRPTVSWAASRETWPAGQGKWFCPSTLLWRNPTWSSASSSGALSTGKTGNCWSGSRQGPQKLSEGWNTSPVRKGWESCGCSACRSEGSRDTLRQPSSTLRGPTRKLENDFLQGHVVIGQGGMALNSKRVDLH